MKGRLLAGVALGAFFLWLSLRHVDLAGTWETIRLADYRYFIPFILLNVLALWFRAVRWGYLLKPIRSVPAKRLLSPLCIGFMANFIFPARAGEFIRAYLLGKREGVSKSAAFATVVVERLFDGLAIISFLALAPLFLHTDGNSFIARLKWAGIALFLVYITILGVLLALSHHQEAFSRYLARSRPAQRWKVVRKLFEIVQKFTEGLAILKSPGEVVVVLTISYMIWGLSGITNWFMMGSVGLDLPLYAAYFLVVIQSFGVMVPSPGFVGSYQYAHIVALAVYGVSETVAFGLAVLIHAGYFVLFMAAGLWFFLRGHLGWQELEEASSEEG